MRNQFKAILVALSVMMLTMPLKAEIGLNYAAMAKKTGKGGGSGSGAAHKGMIVLQPDINLGDHGGWNNRGWAGRTFIPGFTFNADFGVHDYVSVGPYVGFGGRSGVFHIAAGARCSFHWWQLLDDKVGKDLKSDKIDFYLPAYLGFNAFKVRDFKGQFNFGGGAGLGFRYYFIENMGVNLEFGWMEMSYAKIGVQFKI